MHLTTIPPTVRWGAGCLRRVMCIGDRLLQFVVIGVLQKLRLEAACPLTVAASFVHIYLLREVDRDALDRLDGLSTRMFSDLLHTPFKLTNHMLMLGTRSRNVLIAYFRARASDFGEVSRLVAASTASVFFNAS